MKVKLGFLESQLQGASLHQILLQESSLTDSNLPPKSVVLNRDVHRKSVKSSH